MKAGIGRRLELSRGGRRVYFRVRWWAGDMVKPGYNFQVEILGAPDGFDVEVRKREVKGNSWIYGFADWVDSGAIHGGRGPWFISFGLSHPPSSLSSNWAFDFSFLFFKD